MSRFAHSIRIPSRTGSMLLLVGGVLAIASFNALLPPPAGLISLAVVVGLTVALMIMYKYHWGLYVVWTVSIFMFYFGRIAKTEFPFGIFIDLLIVLTGASLFTKKEFVPDRQLLTHPITYAFLVLIFYHLIGVLNPEGTFIAWLVSMRNLNYFLLYIICFYAISTFRQLERLTWVWMGLALIVALYGIYQQIFGLTDFEMDWIYENPERFGIYFVWGTMRKFSFLSDPSAYGIYLAFGSLSALMLCIMSVKARTKVLFGVMAGIMVIAMSYSGTRTAIAMVVAGLAFFFMLTIRSRRTVVAAIVLGTLGAVIMLGPFYGWQINRIRSTFSLKEDPSMGVRFNKRVHYQPYVQSHPIGAGVFTTALNGLSFAPGHELAGFDPDSGYLETALEQGWIGLLLLLAFLFVAVRSGINSYFSMEDRRARTLLLTYLVPLFALTVVHFAQNAMFTKPTSFVYIMCLAVIVRLHNIDKASP